MNIQILLLILMVVSANISTLLNYIRIYKKILSKLRILALLEKPLLFLSQKTNALAKNYNFYRYCIGDKCDLKEKKIGN